jgi:hypothetical protein
VETTGGAEDLLAQGAAPHDLDVPEGLQDVTSAWLTDALRRTGRNAGVVVGFEADPLAGGRGFLGQTIRFRLRVAETSPFLWRQQLSPERIRW